MAGVAHADGLGHYRAPGHLGEVIAQGHRVGDDLHAVLQGTVMLDVDVLQTVAVGRVHQLPRPVAALPRPVDFQLHAEIACPFPIENGVRLVVIAVNFPGIGTQRIAAVT